jgi:hypothetical protein
MSKAMTGIKNRRRNTMAQLPRKVDRVAGRRNAIKAVGVVEHLALVWNTARTALEVVGEKPTPAHMHVMVEEAGKILRPLAPKLGS